MEYDKELITNFMRRSQHQVFDFRLQQAVAAKVEVENREMLKSEAQKQLCKELLLNIAARCLGN